MKFKFDAVLKPDAVLESDWFNWQWQMRCSLKNKSDFEKYFTLTEQEARAFEANQNQKKEIFNIRTTPYYAVLANSLSSFSENKCENPLRTILMPHELELKDGLQEELDPLGERKIQNNPTSRIIHRYSDRLLFLVTDMCSVYCRYCTRKHFTGSDQVFINNTDYEKALAYIRSKTGLREVILSGGDPLTLSDAQLERILFDLRKIEHIEIIRIGSRMPVVNPMRITSDLVHLIRKNKPVYLMTHFNHPKELTKESSEALELCVDHGIPVMNQMVLLNGVNNHPALVQALSRRLLFLRVKPYYMFQCDPSEGTDHLRTSFEQSLQIQKELWGHLSGLAMPHLSVDIPQGGGKAYYVPQFETYRDEHRIDFTGWDGVKAQYLNPPLSNMKVPSDAKEYLSEWTELKETKKG